MQIQLATSKYSDAINAFLDDQLDKNNPAITCKEFFCPDGVKGAIKRKQVVICLDDNIVVAAIRFYPRKKDDIVSVYQFAIEEEFRSKNLLKKCFM